jgi:2-polyprenyl-6-methoxyphenol hydroxylase-like FAD-dependent oxidoreductase
MSQTYDAIVVGARCAGSPAAMLLARRGHRVLLVDRATFPSDTTSTHLIHPPGVASLERWGLLDRVVATGSPPIDTYAFDFGPFTISGAPGTDAAPVAYAPRRTVLDKLLVDAASEAGAEVRERFTVDELVVEDGRVLGIRGHTKGGKTVTELARVVVGADGRYSFVAGAVNAEEYNGKPQQQVSYYTYWSGLPMSGRFETTIRPGLAFAAWPTSDDLTLIIAGRSIGEFDTVRKDVEATYLATLEIAPAFADRVRDAKREERFVGTAVRAYFRKPFGPGWALVGDAGYNKDFITAQGIHDAFRDAEACATAIDDALEGRRSFEHTLGEYQVRRDEQVRAMYEFTAELASLTPPPPEMQQLLKAVSRSQEAMDGFARVTAGVMSPAAFFSTRTTCEPSPAIASLAHRGSG